MLSRLINNNNIWIISMTFCHHLIVKFILTIFKS